ncbi:AraC family transcriptional regulator [Teichococcus vastitatis]|uniref:AraC family transcriptional regulator n=1 Tax=Teichococcus vastitatis TaxID=2307076 RepID=A0ABS9W8A1_9PROT|nr:AraC family transcriptional regulator [Pseudoroseomonas vastitatis]MCI0755525.1 AraC family transcriptional regulator [Pseudoroseomonas vastitatis]
MTDPLSDVLSLLEVQGLGCSRLEATGPWSLRFEARPLLKFVAVLRGTCWIALEGEAPHQVEANDTFLLVDAPAYVVSSHPALRTDDGERLFATPGVDVVRLGGAEVVLLGGRYLVKGEALGPLLGALPRFLRVPAGTAEAEALRSILGLLDDELGREAVGASLMTKRLAEILLVQALRAWASDARVTAEGATLGWIGALVDRQIGAALQLIHRDVGHRWTVGALAAAVGMSRSAFALRFRERVGTPPLEYLLRWRMERARAALRRGDASVTAVAAELGYASDNAFGVAFRREFGLTPRSDRLAARGRAGADAAEPSSS